MLTVTEEMLKATVTAFIMIFGDLGALSVAGSCAISASLCVVWTP